ncbi:pili assembly chaperone [Aliidiomarina minuta]|uniref:Pili assembly chaperone n=1 Tax=Aliidiomarina minuta TaxID=880057 RepID=A0A432W973_9GAMM|nr:prepilin-type N-terminal cleavage/methylation domain-containing protein [Aliidiomarina minuta]RUO26674.1 pili assembly chaperone [Aliidiomarina minuta]
MPYKKIQQGFTLIEIIMGIVVLAIALLLITSVLLPAARQSITPVYQVRAAELGQSLLNEIMAKSFDQASDRRGGRQRCKADQEPLCTAPDQLGPDNTETRDRFNDVDDYHGLSGSVESALGEDLSDLYPGFSVQINVCYSDANASQCLNEITLFKRVQITVFTPDNQPFEFSALRGNF